MMHNLLTSGKYVELLDHCSTILRKDPQNLEALKYKAYSLYFLGKFEDAISFYDKVIELEPSNPSHYTGKSKALEKLGREKEARKCYKQARRIENTVSDMGHNENEWGFVNG